MSFWPLRIRHTDLGSDDDPDMNAFPHVVDIMVRILTSKGLPPLLHLKEVHFPLQAISMEMTLHIGGKS